MNERYAKQIKLPQLGPKGQERLAQARVLCVGAGGLGSPVILYLSAAGIGYIDVIDPDQVDITNLQRQILFKESHLGLSKAKIATQQIHALNSSIHCNAFEEYFSPENAEALIVKYDLVIDGSDNFQTKLLINDACYKHGIPWIYAGVSQFEGQVALFQNRGGACYRCLFPNPAELQIQSCEQAGVLGPVVGVLGCLQATLALEHFLGIGPTKTQVCTLDLLGDWSFRNLEISKQTNCPTCSKNPETIQFETDYCYLDVRTQAEWDTGHRPGAIHWPLDRIERGDLPVLPAGKNEWRIYCQTGYRAAVANNLLKSASVACSI